MTITPKLTTLPQISEANYEAVRRVLKDSLPATHREWLYFLTKWTADFPNHVFVDVDPQEFAKFFGTSRRGDDIQTLLDFVWVKP
jgi:hypothetical protein